MLKVARAETGSDGSKREVHWMREQEGRWTAGGDGESRARAPLGTATSVRGAAIQDIDPGDEMLRRQPQPAASEGCDRMSSE
jgi:hypothetical protein